MTDYTWQSVYFSYLLFAVLAGGAVFFFIRSVKDGYLGPNSEGPKYRMLEDDPELDPPQPNGATAPRRP
ncbi:MAG: hypothetical protein P4L26_09410 [Terracidiphilus sp.]|nr:hypothetical protein [Terracidiphilus sp.]